MYITDISRKFKNKGFYDPDQGVLISTMKDTEGQTFDIQEALETIGAGGVEIDITISQRDTTKDVSPVE